MPRLYLLEDGFRRHLAASITVTVTASGTGAFASLAFASVAFNTGVAGTVAPSVSVSVPPPAITVVPSGQYVAGLGQLISLGANPGGHQGQGLILWPDTGELEVQDKYSKTKSRARRTWR